MGNSSGSCSSAAHNIISMGNSGLKQHLDTAQKTGAFKLSDKGLSEFPSGLDQICNSLRTLDLSQNKLQAIPTSIGNYSLLKYLNLERNRLTSIPNEINQLPKLETLLLGKNQLTTLSVNAFSKLKHLKQLSLCENAIREFPAFLSGLPQLDVLNLADNKIEKIPSGVQDLQVTDLNLNGNQVAAISEDIAACPRLKTLRLDENCLSLEAVPTKILTDSQVSLLSLEGNLFEVRALVEIEGYDKYMERYTATKKKMY